MTNMATDLINTSTQLADKSPWAWLIFLFLSWLAISAYGLRYTVKRLEESWARQHTLQEERIKLVQELTKEKEELHLTHAARMELIIKEHLTAQLRIADALSRLERLLEREKLI